MFCKYILLITFLKESRLILLNTVKGFQVLPWITNNSIKHQSFVYSHLDDQIVQFLTIQFPIVNFFAHSLHVKSLYSTDR